MNESVLSRASGRTEMIQSKLLLNNFSPNPKKSQIDLRKNEGREQLYCELCNKLYQLDLFRAHIGEHRRQPKERIPTLGQLYRSVHAQSREKEMQYSAVPVTVAQSIYLSNQNPENHKVETESLIYILDSKKHIVIQPQEQMLDSFEKIDYVNQRRQSLPVGTHERQTSDIFPNNRNNYPSKMYNEPQQKLNPFLQIDALKSVSAQIQQNFRFVLNHEVKRSPPKAKNIMAYLQSIK